MAFTQYFFSYSSSFFLLIGGWEKTIKGAHHHCCVMGLGLVYKVPYTSPRMGRLRVRTRSKTKHLLAQPSIAPEVCRDSICWTINIWSSYYPSDRADGVLYSRRSNLAALLTKSHFPPVAETPSRSLPINAFSPHSGFSTHLTRSGRKCTSIDIELGRVCSRFLFPVDSTGLSCTFRLATKHSQRLAASHRVTLAKR